jgi:hypothetical protein
MAVIKPNPTAWTVNSLANGANGISGQVLQSNGITGSYYTNTAISTSTTVDAAMIVNQGKMTITVPLEINGIDVEQVLKDLMQVTGIISRNRLLEAKHRGLRESGERYQALLQKVHSDVNIIIKEAAAEYRLAEEKYKTFETIKDSK